MNKKEIKKTKDFDKFLKKNNFIQSGGYAVTDNKTSPKNIHTEFAIFKKADDKFKYKNKKR